MSNKNPNHRNIFRLLYHGNKAQVEKLKRDKDKPDFLDHSLKELKKLKDDKDKELNIELSKFINAPNSCDLYSLLTAIEKEAADTSNLSHMIILKCKDLNGEL